MPERHDYGRVHPRHRTVEIPNQSEHPWRYRWAVLRWRLAVLTVTHTVSLAMAISFLIAAIPAWLILATAKDTRALTHEAQHQRIGSTRVFCEKMRENTRAVNHEARYIEALIVQGAVESKAFDPLLRQYNLPPYEARLKKARMQAAKLDSYTVRPLNCNHFVREVSNLANRSR